MSDPTYEPTHTEILLELVRSRTSALGDKTWGIDELVKHSGLRPHQVSNAIARIVRLAKLNNEEPLLRAKTGAKGQYVYTGPLKRGRKPKDVTHAATPTEEVPFTEDAVDVPRYHDVKDVEPLEDEGQIVATNESPTRRLNVKQPPLQNVRHDPDATRPNIVEGFAKIGEQMSVALGGISAGLGVDEAMKNAVEAEKAVAREKAVKSNKVSRVRRLMRELEQEMKYLEREWDQLTEKGRRYDKLTMTMFGFSSNDPTAVDRLKENGE